MYYKRVYFFKICDKMCRVFKITRTGNPQTRFVTLLFFHPVETKA